MMLQTSACPDLELFHPHYATAMQTTTRHRYSQIWALPLAGAYDSCGSHCAVVPNVVYIPLLRACRELLLLMVPTIWISESTKFMCDDSQPKIQCFEACLVLSLLVKSLFRQHKAPKLLMAHLRYSKLHISKNAVRKSSSNKSPKLSHTSRRKRIRPPGFILKAVSIASI